MFLHQKEDIYYTSPSKIYSIIFRSIQTFLFIYQNQRLNNVKDGSIDLLLRLYEKMKGDVPLSLLTTLPRI